MLLQEVVLLDQVAVLHQDPVAVRLQDPAVVRPQDPVVRLQDPAVLPLQDLALLLQDPVAVLPQDPVAVLLVLVVTRFLSIGFRWTCWISLNFTQHQRTLYVISTQPYHQISFSMVPLSTALLWCFLVLALPTKQRKKEMLHSS